ncbi:hypothetical protein GXB82_21950 [Pseudomonas stutzeri]|nr:hypothetical protein [Stutzerimonas stutzeri]
MNDTLKGALALGILIGRQTSNPQLEALANDIAAGIATEGLEGHLAQLGQGSEGPDLISTAVKEAVYNRASEGHYDNLSKLNDLAKALSLRSPR